METEKKKWYNEPVVIVAVITVIGGGIFNLLEKGCTNNEKTEATLPQTIVQNDIILNNNIPINTDSNDRNLPKPALPQTSFNSKVKKPDIKVINSTIYTENQSGGSNTVNIIRSSSSYIQPSDSIIRTVNGRLKSFKIKHQIPNVTWIQINIESGSSLRYKLANDLEDMLSMGERGWASFGRTNISTGRFPEYPISIFYNNELENVVDDLVKSIEPYLKKGITKRPDANYSKGSIHFYINGNPLFDSQGTVEVE